MFNRYRFLLFGISMLVIFISSTSTKAQGVFGTGADGSLVVSGTHHLTADVNLTDLTINPGGVLETHGYIVRVSGTLINNGTITDSFSGGNGGSGGSGGLGGRFFDGHVPPQSGQAGGNGLPPSVSGGGFGGRGGGGGGGGGGTWDNTWNEAANGGTGGTGGSGGKGGGVITIYANIFDNNSLISASGFNATSGSNGSIGGFRSWTVAIFLDYDQAGGGGGGGGGANGGNGGTVAIYYGTNLGSGSLLVNGGSGVSGRPGGSGRNTSEGAGASQNEENGNSSSSPFPAGGTGGRGEVSSAASGAGSAGQSGQTGTAGTVILQATVTCYVDNDADGYGDAGDPGTPQTGTCGAGFSTNNMDCDDGNPSINPGATEIVGDMIDQNCDGMEACYVDNDSDGFGSGSITNSIDLDCFDLGESDNSNDCNDSDPSIYPGATEIVGDGIDQDCNGMEACYADNDADGFGSGITINSVDFDCFDVGESDNNFDCDDNNPAVNPSSNEIMCNGLDDDCNGATADDTDSDSDGVSLCAGDCDDNDPARYPGNVEIQCNGIDDDCNPGTADDPDFDGDGISLCAGDCDDNDPARYPGNVEIQCNGIDDDCNPSTADDVDIDNDGVSFCAGDCDDNDPNRYPGNFDIPDDGIDQDCDGMDATCCLNNTGNVNEDPLVNDILDISDLLYLVDYFFLAPPGPAPICDGEADVNNSGLLDISDLLYMVDYFFASPAGPAPLPCL